jgi:CRISPR-associated protein Cas1
MWRLWRQAFRAREPRQVCEGARLEDIAALDTLAEAWSRVRANKGGPGGDGVSIADFEPGVDAKLPALADELISGRYRPKRLRRVPIEKKDGGVRWLAIPSLMDRICQVAALIALAPDLDARMSETSWAYRAGRGVDGALAAVDRAFEDGFRWTVDADIRRYFDSVPHRRLMEDVSIWIDDERIVTLIALWLASFGARGIAQGAPISPLLANMFLHPLDRLIAAEGHTVVRYADDFLVLCRDRKSAEKALQTARGLLRARGLKLNGAKTRIIAPGDALVFLGRTLTAAPSAAD